MAGENDVFTVLGKVEIDQNALKASMAKTEAEVNKFAERQSANFKKMSQDFGKSFFGGGPGGGPPGGTPKGPGGSTSTWWSDPNMAGFGEGGGGAKVKKHLDDIGEGFKKTGHHAGLTISNIRGFSHVINEAIPGMGGMASGLISVARHLGPVGAIALVAAGAFAIFHGRLAEEARLNYEVSRSQKTLDYGRITGEVKKLDEALAEQQDLQKRAAQQITGLGSFVDAASASIQGLWAIFTGKGEVDIQKRLEKIGPTVADMYDKASGPGARAAIEAAREWAGISEKSAQFNLKQADTADRVTQSYSELASAQTKATDAAIAEIRRQLEEDEAKPENQANKVKLRRDANEKIRIEEAKLAAEQKENAEEEKRRQAELVTAVVVSTNKIAESYSKQALSALELRKAEVDASRQIAQLRGEMARDTVDASESINKATDIEVQKIRQAEDTAEAASKNIVANLKAQVEAGIDVVANQRAIAEEEASRATGRIEAENKIATLGIQKNQERAAEAKRVYDAEISRITSTTEAYFNMRKAMGDSTIHGEIQAQQALNNLYKVGTAEYYNGLAKVASLQKQMRDEAKSTFQQIAGAAAESLKKRTGRTNFTAAELQAEAGNIEKQGNKLLGEFGSGKSVNTDALMKSLNMQGGFEAFAAQGGDLRERFNAAITKGGGGFAAAGTSTFATGAPQQDFSKLMKASADLFNTGVGDFQEAVEKFAAAQSGSGSPDLQQAALSSTIGLMGQREAKRGPAPQTGLS